MKPPTSSSLGDEERVPSLLLSTAARDPCLIAPLAMLAPRGSRFVAAYFVVARGRRACPLTSPQHGGARSVFDCSARYARSARIALCSRLLRRRSGTKSVSPHFSSARRRAIRV